MNAIKIITATLALILALVLTLALAPVASATVFGFEAVEGPLPDGMITVDVTGSGSLVQMTFANADTASSSVTNIYWDFGAASGAFGQLGLVSASTGVNFLGHGGSLIPSAPANLPGGNAIGFSADFAVQANPVGGKPHNGVNGGEFLTLSLALNEGYDYQWLVGALTSGEVRMGVHVLSLAGGFSASGVTSATPIPGSMWLLGSGLVGLVGLSRIRRG